MNLENQFNYSCQVIKTLKQRPTNEELLELYSLYKQATVGNVNTVCPSVFYYINRQKWLAWFSKKNMNQNVAKQMYINLTNKLLSKYPH